MNKEKMKMKTTDAGGGIPASDLVLMHFLIVNIKFTNAEE